MNVHDPHYFVSPEDLHRWFARHHDRVSEVWLGFHRLDSGRPSISYADALDEALCWGWIDGICKRWDATSWVQRFTPRRARSIWSKVNIAKVEALERAGRLQPAGRAAFARRTAERSGVYSFEQDEPAAFAPVRARVLREARAAQAHFAAQPPSYRRTVTHWVESARQEATRQRRFEKLLLHSGRGERLPEFSPARKRQL